MFLKLKRPLKVIVMRTAIVPISSAQHCSIVLVYFVEWGYFTMRVNRITTLHFTALLNDGHNDLDYDLSRYVGFLLLVCKDFGRVDVLIGMSK
jgi:hypothetical protein